MTVVYSYMKILAQAACQCGGLGGVPRHFSPTLAGFLKTTLNRV